MKRSSKVVLLFRGTAAAGSVSMGVEAANAAACKPARPGFAMPGYDEYGRRCMTRGGFGGTPHRFEWHHFSGGG